MPENEQRRPFPAWAEQERAGDLAWIAENLPDFWAAASTAYEAQGRGTLVVDSTVTAPAAGHPFGYLSQKQI